MAKKNFWQLRVGDTFTLTADMQGLLKSELSDLELSYQALKGARGRVISVNSRSGLFRVAFERSHLVLGVMLEPKIPLGHVALEDMDFYDEDDTETKEIRRKS